jgi:hypothetical protein
MRRALIASFDFIQQIVFEFPRFIGVKKTEVKCAPMPQGAPVYEKDKVVEYGSIIDFTRKLSDS